jgi:hypothetical protein
LKSQRFDLERRIARHSVSWTFESKKSNPGGRFGRLSAISSKLRYREFRGRTAPIENEGRSKRFAGADQNDVDRSVPRLRRAIDFDRFDAVCGKTVSVDRDLRITGFVTLSGTKLKLARRVRASRFRGQTNDARAAAFPRVEKPRQLQIDGPGGSEKNAG